MSKRKLPLNKNLFKNFLYEQGIKEYGDGASDASDVDIRRAGIKRIRDSKVLALGQITLGIALVAGGVAYAAHHGSAGPLNNGPEVTRTQDPLPPSSEAPVLRAISPTDTSLPK